MLAFPFKVWIYLFLAIIGTGDQGDSTAGALLRLAAPLCRSTKNPARTLSRFVLYFPPVFSLSMRELYSNALLTPHRWQFPKW